MLSMQILIECFFLIFFISLKTFFLFKGTDITELFETHHLNSKAATDIMRKFHVRQAETPRKSPFTFKEDGFYNVMKSRVVKKLAHVNRDKAPVKSMLVVDTYFLIALALCVGVAQTQNYFLAVLAGIVLAFGTVASHNFTHLKGNWRMYYVNLCLMSLRQVIHFKIIIVVIE